MKKILITGGVGFIGFHLALHCITQGNHVTLVDNFFRGKNDDAFRKLVKKEECCVVECDLTDPTNFNKLETNFDEVYHLAAINGTRHFYEIPEVVLRTNILSSLNIMEWFCKKNKNKTSDDKIIFSSSSETYAGTIQQFDGKIPTPEDIPLSITEITNPRWSYAVSKIAGEAIFINYATKFNKQFSIVRYHNIYGPRMGTEHVIPQFINRLLDKNNPFKIFGGHETRAFCYISDAVEATVRVMSSKESNGEIIHIGNDQEEISILKLAEKLFAVAYNHPTINVESAPKGSVKRRCPDVSKLYSLTGFKASIPLQTGLQRTYDWYKKEHSKVSHP